MTYDLQLNVLGRLQQTDSHPFHQQCSAVHALLENVPNLAQLQPLANSPVQKVRKKPKVSL